jgi:hypothetical protein
MGINEIRLPRFIFHPVCTVLHSVKRFPVILVGGVNYPVVSISHHLHFIISVFDNAVYSDEEEGDIDDGALQHSVINVVALREAVANCYPHGPLAHEVPRIYQHPSANANVNQLVQDSSTPALIISIRKLKKYTIHHKTPLSPTQKCKK